MNEPKRWVDDDAPRDVEQLFRAARAERPEDASLGRALTAVAGALSATSITAGAGAASTVASGGAKIAAPSTVGLVAKWTALGAALGTLIVGAAAIVRSAPWAAQVETHPAGSAALRPGSIRPAPGDPEPTFVDSSRATSIAEPEKTPSVAVAAASTTPLGATPAAAAASGRPLAAETLTEEVRHVDRARAALAAGHAIQALARLDEYARRFPQRRFAPEALYLRMEALASLGRTAQARAVAEQLLASYPGSPNGERARAVLAKKP